MTALILLSTEWYCMEWPSRPKNTSMKSEEGMFNYYKWEQSCILARENAVSCDDQEGAAMIFFTTRGDDNFQIEENKPYILENYSIEITDVKCDKWCGGYGCIPEMSRCHWKEHPKKVGILTINKQ